MVHRPADPLTLAWNQAREAEWHAARAAQDAAAAELERILRDLAPAVFAGPPVPLQIGIHHHLAELLADEADSATISRFLRHWTKRTAYIQAIVRGDARRDLDGQPTGEPSRAERESAAESLAARG
jgi:sRNA-binding protein